MHTDGHTYDKTHILSQILGLFTSYVYYDPVFDDSDDTFDLKWLHSV